MTQSFNLFKPQKPYKVMALLLALMPITLVLGALAPIALASGQLNAKESNILYMDLKTGRVTIEMFPKLAPKHVARIKKLVREGFYDGVVFHRVIDGFMAQTGDPTGTGRGGSPYGDVEAEFTWDETFSRGTVGAARGQDPNSANSQFFICFEKAAFLDRQYTIWGRVIDGMEHVDQIARGEPPPEPDKIIKMTLAED